MRRNVTVQAFVLSTIPVEPGWVEASPRFHTPAGRFPLEAAAGAHAAVEAGTKLGTVVVPCRAEGSVH
jgi:hypothetical protein